MISKNCGWQKSGQNHISIVQEIILFTISFLCGGLEITVPVVYVPTKTEVILLHSSVSEVPSCASLHAGFRRHLGV